MSVSYAKQLPVDRNGASMHNSPPAFPALASFTRENASTSSAFGLNPNTTEVEVTAGAAPVGIKWGGSVIGVSLAVATANYDNIVAPNTTRLFVVPRLSAGIPNYNADQSPSVVGMNRSEGLYTHLATIAGGVSSVFLTEY